jgi:stringent starvation protein B
MIPTKPYLIRAIHEWCVDQGFTPYLSVRVDENTRVPREFVRDGQIVLNVSTDATHQLMMGNEEISFQTRFNGASFPVLVPVSAVLAIYARENGQGIAFEVAPAPVANAEETSLGDQTQAAGGDEAGSAEPGGRRAGHLTRIK